MCPAQAAASRGGESGSLAGVFPVFANPGSAPNSRSEAVPVPEVEGVAFAQVRDSRGVFWDGCLGPAPGLRELWLTFVDGRGERGRDWTWGQSLLVEAI